MEDKDLKDLKKVYFTLDDLLDGVYAISLVDEPAIEANFQTFNKTSLYKFEILDKEKQICSGPIMIPDKFMLRKDEKDEYFMGAFDVRTIEKISQKYMQEGRQSNTTISHKVDSEGITLVESWIIQDTEKDKSSAMGYSLPVGTWFGSLKVNNTEIWNEFIKTGILKGFSIEGWFSKKDVDDENEAEEILNEICTLIQNSQIK